MEAPVDIRSKPIIVGIGASAGGLDAVSGFLGHVAPQRGLALLVMFHLDPSGSSLLRDVLAKVSPLRVIEATDGMRVEPDHVYALPGHTVVTLKDGAICLRPARQPEERRSLIDRFLQSLASDQGERAVGMIFSGAGSDGSLGMRAIASAGGLTMVQEPSTAEHESMPQSASETGVADHVLPPERLAAELLAHAAHLQGPEPSGALKPLVQEVADRLPEVCEVLLHATGHNFSHYKSTTIIRRTVRRIQVLRLTNAKDYVERLRNDREEANRLFTELLINVTAFFRDPEAFTALAKEVLPKLFADGRGAEPVRVWVPGCASGEEAYTLGMLLLEHSDGASEAPQVQIFATDIDENALEVARQGFYPQDIAQQIAPERLRRFFVKRGQRYQVHKALRELVVFSNHNLINDPPFLRLDLISCRNLLIYLGAHLQNRLFPLFHYALRPGGFLFLGPSETLSGHKELFRAIDVKHRISQRLATAVRTSPVLEHRVGGFPSARAYPSTGGGGEPDAVALMQRVLLEDFAPRAVLVNEEGQVLAASGNLDKYLAVTSGAFQNNVTRLVRDGLRVALRAALSESLRHRRKVVQGGLSLRTSEGVERVTMTVQPVPQAGYDDQLFMVVFQDDGSSAASDLEAAGAPGEVAASLIEQLERDLASTREDLEKTVQDLESANEELKSSNEELLSMNEELQSANEELEISKEDLQSANDALIGSNNDLENLLASTRIATLFLDEEMTVRRATPAVADVFNLLPRDVGRPLAHFTHKAKLMPPFPPIRLIYTSERPMEDEVEMLDGSWHVRRVFPYRNPQGAFDGAVVTFIDVTERKRYEERLRYQLNLVRSLTDNATTAIFVMDREGVCTFANPAALEMTGYSREELVGHVLHDKVHYLRPDGSPYPKDECPIDRALPERQQPRDHEDLFVRKDGVFFPVVCNATVVSESGAPESTVIEVRDVTQARQWAEALRESEARLRKAAAEAESGRSQLAAVISAMSQGVLLVSAGGDLVRMNQAAREMYGFSQATDLPAMMRELESMLEVRDQDGTLVEVMNRPSYRTLAGEEVTNVEMRMRRHDGHKDAFVGLFSGALVRSEDGATQFAVLSINNVTDRVEAERAFARTLRQREQELRTLTDNTPLMLTRMDRSYRHVFANATAEAVTGFPRDQLIGRTSRELGMPPDLCDLWEGALARVFETAETQVVDFSFAPKGERRHFMSRLVPEFDADGRVAFVVGVSQDRTAEKLAEASLYEAGRRKDEFLATLAHELRNPLAPIRTGLQVLKLTPPGEPAAAKVRGMMERQLSHMVRLVDDLLDVSRISRGKLELKRQRVTLSSVIDAALEVSRPLIEAARHNLVVHLPDRALWIEADPTRIAQAIGNLLNNAAKYTPEGGHIQLSAVQEDGRVVIRVSDDGDGISPEMLPELFEMFTQVGRTLDKAQGGLGIGLSLVKQLVEMHGGSVRAESEGASRGSTFIIHLPLPPEEAYPPLEKTPGAQAAGAAEGAGRRVLVVDDNVDAAESLAMVLELAGHETRTAHSGAQALEVIETFSPDVGFLDIGLPGMDGHELARRIRESPRLARIKLIALTGWGSEADKQRSREAGFDHHLTKPVEPAAVHKLLENLPMRS